MDSTTKSAPPHSSAGALDRFFSITARGSTVGREVRGGLVTFFTMAYIVALNPIIIGTVPDKYGNLITGAPISNPANIPLAMGAVAAGTALVAGLMTLFMGVYGKFPIAIATGLGLNAMLAYVIAPTMSWPQALCLVVLEGLVITILVLTGFRRAVFKAVPRSLRSAISVGIGLFIAFIGLWDGGLVRAGSGVPVQFGINGSLKGWPILVFLVTLVVVGALYALRVRGALLLALVAGTVLSIIIEAVAKVGPMVVQGKVQNPTGWMLNVPSLTQKFGMPHFETLLRFDNWFGWVAPGGKFNWTATLGGILVIFSLLLSDFFDTMGTVVAVGAQGDLLDEDGNPPRIQQILLVDSIAAMAGGLGGVSSNTSYIESTAGVGEGARTGLASVVTSVCFFLTIFLAPFVNMIPSEAAAPILVFVGFLMMSQVVKVNWEDIEEGLPAFLAIVLMPFAYSITAGIGFGFIFYVIMKLVRGKAKEIHPLMYVIAALFVMYFVQGLIIGLL